MWYSLTPKRLHISLHWVTITDYRKKVGNIIISTAMNQTSLYPSIQVMYIEVPVSSIGSLSYAEDDGKHILGLKAVQPTAVGGASPGIATPTASEVGGGHSVLYCCYVIECATEASAFKIPWPIPIPQSHSTIKTCTSIIMHEWT